MWRSIRMEIRVGEINVSVFLPVSTEGEKRLDKLSLRTDYISAWGWRQSFDVTVNHHII